jgi:hypothetical protein
MQIYNRLIELEFLVETFIQKVLFASKKRVQVKNAKKILYQSIKIFIIWELVIV